MQGENLTILIVLIAIIVALIFVWLFIQRRRTDALRNKFGEEYDRTIEARGGRAKAESDLREREERVKALDIRPLGPAERERFSAEWKESKALFVDSPIEAISRSDRLLGEVMKTRGYPMGDFEHRHADLTVEHGEVAKDYRAGHDIAERSRSGQATTEELRQAMNHYERLFDTLVNETTDTVAARPVTSRAQE